MTVQDPNASLLKRRKSSGKDIDDFIIEDDDDFVVVKVKAGIGTETGTGIGTGSEDEEETGYFMKEAEVVVKQESLKVVREGEEFQENGVESEMMLEEVENDGGVSLGVESQLEEVCISRWMESKVTISQQMRMSQQMGKENEKVPQKVKIAELGACHYNIEQADHQRDDVM